MCSRFLQISKNLVDSDKYKRPDRMRIPSSLSRAELRDYTLLVETRERTMETKLVLFDIDGTLLHAGETPRIAYERAMGELFGKTDFWGAYSAAGKTDPIITRELAYQALGRELEEQEYERLVKRYIEHFREEIRARPQVSLLPGVTELLERIRAIESAALAVQTGNFTETAKLKLEAGGVLQYFNTIGCGSDSSKRAEFIRIAIKRAEMLLSQAILGRSSTCRPSH